jgi:MFS family permease
MGTAAALAQILGGVLVQADLFGSSWRPAFLINVPVGIAGLVLARRTVPETKSPQAASIDLPGTALLGAAVITLLIPLAVGRDEHWPVWGWVMLGAAPVAAVAFAAVQLRKERRGILPLLPPSLLGAKGLLPGLFFAVTGFSVFGGFMLTISVAFQFGRHFGPIEAGLTLTPYALSWLVASLLTRGLAARFGRNLIVFGAVGMAVGFGIIAVQAHNGFSSMSGADFAPALILIGFCQAAAVIPALSITLSAVPPERAGVAAGVFATVQQSAIALGTAGLGTLFFTLVADHGYGPALTTAEIVQAAGALVAAVVALGMPKGR